MRKHVSSKWNFNVRKVYLEVYLIIKCFFVYFNHTFFFLFHSRSKEKIIHFYEQNKITKTAERERFITEFSRSAAGNKTPSSFELRTKNALNRTIKYLLTEWVIGFFLWDYKSVYFFFQNFPGYPPTIFLLLWFHVWSISCNKTRNCYAKFWHKNNNWALGTNYNVLSLQ